MKTEADKPKPKYIPHPITCQGCGEKFSAETCEIAKRTLPNTFNDLEDRNNPAAVCPHCGYAS